MRSVALTPVFLKAGEEKFIWSKKRKVKDFLKKGKKISFGKNEMTAFLHFLQPPKNSSSVCQKNFSSQGSQ